MNIGSVNPIVGLDVPSGVCRTCTEMLKKSPIFDPDLQEQLLSDYDVELKLKLQEWDKLIANKKSLMPIIFEQCDEATRTTIALGASYEDNFEAGKLIKFLARVHKVYNVNYTFNLQRKLHKLHCFKS